MSAAPKKRQKRRSSTAAKLAANEHRIERQLAQLRIAVEWHQRLILLQQHREIARRRCEQDRIEQRSADRIARALAGERVRLTPREKREVEYEKRVRERAEKNDAKSSASQHQRRGDRA